MTTIRPPAKKNHNNNLVFHQDHREQNLHNQLSQEATLPIIWCPYPFQKYCKSQVFTVPLRHLSKAMSVPLL